MFFRTPLAGAISDSSAPASALQAIPVAVLRPFLVGQSSVEPHQVVGQSCCPALRSLFFTVA